MFLRQTLLFFLFAITVFQLEAQVHQANPPWHEQQAHNLTPGTLEKNGLSVSKFKVFQLNEQQLSQPLSGMTSNARNHNINTVLPFPSADGHLRRFIVKPSNTLHPDLSKKFPGIQTFEGIGIDDPSASIRFEITPKGFSGMVWSAQTGTEVIQLIKADNQPEKYIVYNKKAAGRHSKGHFTCGTHDETDHLDAVAQRVSASRNNDGVLRTYRLALAVTAEYTAVFGGTKAGAMAAMATTMNRVNGILKREVAVELQMIPNNDVIIFTNAATDGYTNSDSGDLLDQNQNIIDSAIGNDNYDIGHVFSTSAGGVAYLGSVCIDAIKAGGVTGSQLPQGDVFDVDYVTHEIGHQLGANHTQNNDCSSSFATSFEPGSGSTIMGYAGICFPNIQNNSDAYFHSISINQIKSFTTSAADDCAIKTAINNTRPTADAGADYVIPHSTPFELTGVGTDANNDALTYSWEQMDRETASMPPLATADKGPTFRSLFPSNNPIRQFPAKGTNKDHVSSTWEMLSSVERSLKFRLTVRDNNSNGGNTAMDDMLINVAGNSGPFKIIAPNGNESLAAGLNHEISWSVAGTNNAPINCPTVDIYLSVDGGATYPIVLAENVVNDGVANVFIQNNIVSPNARIKVKGSNNVFFDVSDNDFQITEAQAGFDLAFTPSSPTICQGSGTTIALEIIGIDGFSGSVDLTAALPSSFGNYIFSNANDSPGTSNNLIINTTNTTPPGNYTISITGTSGVLTLTKNITVSVVPQTPTSVSLLAPANNEEEVPLIPSFNWTASDAGSAYNFELSKDATFSVITYSATNLPTTAYTLPINLENGETYFWRIQSTNQCAAGNFSEARSFTVTSNLCQTYTNDNNITISSGAPSTINSDIIIQESGLVNDIKVNLDIAHSWIGDLTVTLQSPSGKKAVLFEEICGNEDRITLGFDNEGSSTIDCNALTAGTRILPMQSFDIFDGEEINGTWSLLVSDGVDLDGGTFHSWSLEVCRAVENTAPLSVLISNTTDPSCNGGTTGSIQASVVGGVPNYTIEWSHGANQLTLNNLSAGTYEVTVTDGNGTSTSATATLGEPSPVVLEEIVQNVTCNGINNGSIQVFPSGGIPGYAYNWANGVRQFNNLNLPDGEYRVTVTDGNNCTADANFTITEPTPIELSFSSDNALNGENGSVTVSVSGGTGDYEYDWSSGATTRDVDNLAPGTFTVVVTDDNGCTKEGEVTVITENTNTQDCYSVTINITLDNYGEENRWELKDGNGEIIETMGPFNNFENGSVQAATLCLPPGCYDFTIFDLWGDGMCCSYGQGGYEIIEDETGMVLASGGSFNEEETKTVCVPSSSTSNSTIIEYCGAIGRNTQYEWIETVEINNQTFNSGDNKGYGDFSETEITVPVGGTIPLAFTPGFGFFEYHENWQIWIDFNGDGDFEDEGEAAFLISGKGRVEGQIGIPSDAVLGKTRIRIAMKWGTLIEPCESFSWGEVEDYTLNLQGSATLGSRNPSTDLAKVFTTGQPVTYTVQERGAAEDLQLFPNPTSDFINLAWKDQKDKSYELFIYNSLGQLQKHQQIPTHTGPNKTNLSVKELPDGVYLLQLRNQDRVLTKEFVITN